MQRAVDALYGRGGTTLSVNPHPYTLALREDWRVNALLAEVHRQRLARLAQPSRRCHRRCGAMQTAVNDGGELTGHVTEAQITDAYPATHPSLAAATGRG